MVKRIVRPAKSNKNSVEEAKAERNRRIRQWSWKPGQSGNPVGKPKLSAEINLIKKLALEKAILLLADIVHDDECLQRMKPADAHKFIETAYDRFGLPKVTRAELTGKDGAPIRSHTDLSKLPKDALKKLAE